LVKAYEQNAKRDHYRFALLCSVIANANRSKGRPFRPEDFMPREPKKKQTWQQQLQFLQAFVSSYEGSE
jgi:hypothetical protein